MDDSLPMRVCDDLSDLPQDIEPLIHGQCLPLFTEKVVKAGKKQHKDAKKAVQPQAHQGLAQAKPAKKKALAKRKADECAEEAEDPCEADADADADAPKSSGDDDQVTKVMSGEMQPSQMRLTGESVPGMPASPMNTALACATCA